jgi:uncharacterized protein YqjF (DUF2071 family)
MQETAHRPWPVPSRPWVMSQRWSRLLFVHWRLAPDVVRGLVPSRLDLDLFDAAAWVSMTPFLITRARGRWLPSIPGLSAFPELNCRTYVTMNGRPGVFFFSLDAGSRVAVEGARRFYHLPYFNARMRCGVRADGGTDYESVRTDSRAAGAVFRASYGAAGELAEPAVGSVDRWLVERYCLYAVDGGGAMTRTEIHHRPWRVCEAWYEVVENTVPAAAGLALPGRRERVVFTEPLDVAVWWPERVEG